MLVEDRNSLDHIDKDNGGTTVVCDSKKIATRLAGSGGSNSGVGTPEYVS